MFQLREAFRILDVISGAHIYRGNAKVFGLSPPGVVSSADGPILICRSQSPAMAIFTPNCSSDLSENTGISLHSTPTLSANGPMIPQKHSQTDEDFNF